MESSGTIEAPTAEAEREAKDALAEERAEQQELDEAAARRAELAAAREAEGLDPHTALPTASDDDGSDVDLSMGVELQLPDLEGVKLSFQGIGGKRPEESEFRVVGGSFKVPGQFEKGQDVFIEMRTRVSEVAFSDVIDNKTAQATTSKRKHKGRVLGAVVMDASSREKLDRLVDGFSVGTIPADEVRRILGITLGGPDLQEQPS